MSYLGSRIARLHKTNRFFSTTKSTNFYSSDYKKYGSKVYYNLSYIEDVEALIESLSEKIANEIVSNLYKGISPEIATSIAFKKYEIQLQTFLRQILRKDLEGRILFHLRALLLYDIRELKWQL